MTEDTRTVTFTFNDPPTVTRAALADVWNDDDPTRPLTYVDETPEGDIVERIGYALEDWEHWADSARWTGADAAEDPPPNPGSWQEVGATTDAGDFAGFEFATNLFAGLRYARSYMRGDRLWHLFSGRNTRAAVRHDALDPHTRMLAARALARWHHMRGERGTPEA
jgi:hypothetical protein